MTEHTPSGPRRRTVAWAVPAVAAAVAAPLAAASPTLDALVLAAVSPLGGAPLTMRVGQHPAASGGDVEVAVTDRETGAAVRGALVTFVLVAGTGRAAFSTTGGPGTVTGTTGATGRAVSRVVHGAAVGSAVLLVSTPGAPTLSYPVVVQRSAVLQLEAVAVDRASVAVGQVLVLSARIDLDLGTIGDDEPDPLRLTWRNAPAALFGDPVLGRRTGTQDDSPNWTLERSGDDIVLTRPAGFPREGLEGTAGWVHLSVTRPVGSAAGRNSLDAVLSTDDAFRLVDPSTRTVAVRYS